MAGKASGHIGRWFGQVCLSLVAHAAGLAHVTRRAQTKAIDAIVAALRKEIVLERLRHAALG